MRRVSSSDGKRPAIWVGARQLADVYEGLSALGFVLRQKALVLAIWIAAWGVAGFVHAKMLRPEYVATIQVLLQPRQIVNDGPEDVRHFHQFLIDSEQCETEVRVLRSEQLLAPIVTALNLASAPEIIGGPNGLLSYVARQIARLDGDVSSSAENVEAYYAFADRVRARRLGLSYVIEISYRAHSGEQAAKVANSIAVAYVAHRLRGVIARDRLRGVYLESRSKALSSQIMSADAGMRFGIIPEISMPDADVRVLGAANLPLGRSYPKTGLLVISASGLGAVSGLLLMLMYQGSWRSSRSSIRDGMVAFSATQPMKAGYKSP